MELTSRCFFSVVEIVRVTEDISYSEALQHFQTQVFDPASINPTIPRGKFSQLMRLLFGPRRLLKSLHEERNLLFHIAQGAFVSIANSCLGLVDHVPLQSDLGV